MDDKVREVNGVGVYTPEDMMLLLKEASTSVTMKIVPSYRNMSFREQVNKLFFFNDIIHCNTNTIEYKQNKIHNRCSSMSTYRMTLNFENGDSMQTEPYYSQ